MRTRSEANRLITTIVVVVTMGALAFGYDTGVIAGALPFMQPPNAQAALELTAGHGNDLPFNGHWHGTGCNPATILFLHAEKYSDMTPRIHKGKEAEAKRTPLEGVLLGWLASSCSRSS
ncbi:hypothetical protein [Gluconobacter oxydans]|uniref:hypothetical protein n=1 Tax=Gluconobacter oxydans TaxID=442 RepID=UPI0039E766B0